jgi:toxin-antitoxin system PIN domain toxin
MTVLLDGNVLIALLVDSHVHHAAAQRWWDARADTTFATTPITQGTLLRFLIRNDLGADAASSVLTALTARPEHEFWPDDLPYDASILRGVLGHRQVTDAYLVALARRRRARLATFDAGLVAGSKVAMLIET